MSDATGHLDQLAPRLQGALGPQYRLTRLLGQGGFGAVYAAHDTTLNREVAIKALRPELAAPVVRERFRREAEAAARLQHPGIIPIYAVGEAESLAWFVMPRISGETLGERLAREGRLPIGEVRRILTQTAEALGAAHAAGVIHRDIKPDNILLEGEPGRVVLTDFGIAKSLDQQPDGKALTTTGLVIGTPDYMSPEQASGEGAVDARSDIFSLGVVGFQMLTGARPFQGRTAAAILMQQLRGPAPAVGQLRPECPASLAVAVDRCLAADPASRWATTQDLLVALRRGSQAVPAGGGELPGRERVPNAVGRFHRTAGWAMVALIAAGLVDIARGMLLALPVVLLLSAGVLAALYGKLWVGGLGWRELLGRRRVGPEGGAGPGGGGGDRTHPIVVQARSDRAAIRRLIGDLPRAEREGLGEVMACVDEAVARAEDLARSLGTALEERDEPRATEAGRALTAAATPLGRLQAFLRERRRAGLAESGTELEEILTALRPPDAAPPSPR